MKEVVFQFNPDKAPGPDGFNANFFRKNWSTVEADITNAVKSFFPSGKLLKQVNRTFVTLIPKSTTASSLTDFRSISCCNLIHKFISNVLCNRLKQVVGELVSRNQCAFLARRNILDCTMLAHEMVRGFKKMTGARVCVKVDLKKAFDSVNRDFALFIMLSMGFPET